MSWFSSGSKYKYRAQEALASAQALEEQQSDIEFRRQLLSNIRQERIARAQLESGNYSDDFSSSSAAGATANIDSSLAGETLYSYDTSKRMKKIQDYQQTAVYNMKKYAKQQQKRAAAFSIAGTVAGAVTGGALGGLGLLGAGVGSGLSGALSGASMVSQIGQGIGQIASGTGAQQTSLGIQNIFSGGSGIYSMNSIESNYQKWLQMIRNNRYQLSSVDPTTNQIIPGSTVYAGNYQILQGIRGYRS